MSKPVLEISYEDTGEEDLQRAWRRRGVSRRIIDRINNPFPGLRTHGLPPRIIEYDFIIGETDITRLLSGGAIIVLYPTLRATRKKEKIALGHWVAILQTPEGINFYDPYGEMIDRQKAYAKSRKTLYKEKENTLVRLLLESGQPVDYSHHVHQYFSSYGKDAVATCGWHCLTRCYFDFLTNDQYNEVVRNMSKMLKLSIDDTVAIFWNGV